MRTVSTREAQHNFAKILHEVEKGASFQVMRRRVPVARLIPISEAGKEDVKVDWSGHGARMAGIWPEGPREIVDAALDDLRGSR